MNEPTMQTLGRYTLRAELGRGGFATVYRALDTVLEREVALKVLKPAWTDDARAVERFMREAKQAARLKHRNIVTIHDVGQAEGRLFIAMELVPGRSLQRVVAEDGPLPWERALVILEQTASALDYAHQQGLIHRDVKPANIILDESQPGDEVHVVLTDFGLVRGAEQASLSSGSTGGIIGTPEYIAPEIWDGQPATAASDIYALACVAHFMLTGQALFSATTPMAVLKRHMEGPLFPQRWPAGVPEDVTQVLRQGLARDPGQRAATASRMAAELQQCKEREAKRKEQEAGSKRQEAEAAQEAREAEQTRQAREAAQRVEEEARRKEIAAAEQKAREERERQAHAAERRAAQKAAAPTVAPPPPYRPALQAGPASTRRIPGWAWVAGGLTLLACVIGAGWWYATQKTPPPVPAKIEVGLVTEKTPPPVSAKIKVGLVTDVGGVNDKSFNQSAWAGVQKAMKEFGMDAKYIESKQPTDYEKNIDQFATEGYPYIIIVGFSMGDATAAKAMQYPNLKFAIIDNAYFPTKGAKPCDETKKDCYSDGGLKNVTSLVFQEDEVGFLAGVVAGGLTKSGVVCTVSGMEIPPVVRFVVGYQNGAKWANPNLKTPLNVYIPSFVDPAKGKETAQSLIGQGCDVVFGVGGNTGNGGLLAAKEKGLMAIGVDVDQYLTYPEVKDALVTSAMKNADAAVYNYLKTVAEGSAEAGIMTANLKTGGVGLAPYHDWDSKIPQAVKDKVKQATDGLKSGKLQTGYKP